MLSEFKKYNRNYAVAKINGITFFYFYHNKMYGIVNNSKMIYIPEVQMKIIINSLSKNDD